MFKIPFAITLYAVAFHFSYLSYINPYFEYAHFSYITSSLESLFFTYSLLVIPVIGYKTSSAPSSYGAVLIFVLCYVPGLLVMLFMWRKSSFELIMLQISLAISMFILLRISSWGWKTSQLVRKIILVSSNSTTSKIIGILTAFSLLFLIIDYHQHMRLVAFEDVYDLRSEANATNRGILSNYSIMWLSYSLLPFYITRGIITRNFIDLSIGLMGCILLYMATGTKAAILTPIIIYTLHRITGTSKQFMLKLLIILSIFIFFLILIPEVSAVKSLLLIRTLAVGGWTMATYYDYFTTHGYTFYTHISPIKALTDAYPYGEYGLGQLIGIEYSGSEEANWNANFWSSDAIAAMGITGVPVVTIVLCIVFILINKISKNFSSHFIFLWLSGFWLSLLNIPLTTALLSGGGLITMLLLWMASRKYKKTFQLQQNHLPRTKLKS